MAFLCLCLCDSSRLAPYMTMWFWGTGFSSKLLKQIYIVECLKSSIRLFYGRYGDLFQQYQVSFPRMFTEILTLEQLQWLPNRLDFLLIDLDTELDLYCTTSGFYWVFAMVVACQQKTLTLSDTWSVRFGTRLCSNCLDQFSRTCRVFSRLLTLKILGIFSILPSIFIIII